MSDLRMASPPHVEAPQAPAVRARGLTKSFRSRTEGRSRQVVAGIDLTINAGQVFGLLGANGAGKTTTIKMLCGLIEPTSGHIEVNGVDVRRHRRQAMAGIGAVLEGTRNVYWQLSPCQNLRYFAHLKGCSGRVQVNRAERLLSELDLWDRRHDQVASFSRGMQQKVAIACALIADPSLILLDEPTLGLDYQAARTVKAWIHRLARDEGKTVLLTSHQLDMVQEVCDRVAMIHRGRLVVDEPIDELLTRFDHELYDIQVTGDPANAAQPWVGFTCAVRDYDMLLTGPIKGPPAMRAVLDEIHRRSLTVVSVNRRQPSLEEVFFDVITENPRSEP